MDLSTLQLFAEDLICPVCLEEFDDPRVLPCHHYYCAKCIQGLARTTEYLLCPECRTVAVVSRNGDGLSMFPPAFMVNRLKEKVDKSREQLLASSGGGIALCSDHSGCPVMFACLDCHLAVCPKCLTSNHKGHSYDSLAKVSIWLLLEIIYLFVSMPCMLAIVHVLRTLYVYAYSVCMHCVYVTVCALCMRLCARVHCVCVCVRVSVVLCVLMHV